jgi:hypothetical protein
LPPNKTEARRLQRRAQAYTIINSKLYKCSVSGIFQKCVEPEEGRELLKEIHQGECGHHASSRALVAKGFRHGFYWPTALRDADLLVKHCNGCQRFSKHRHTPAAALKTIPLTWPFAVWGLDMVGPFKMAPRDLTHLLVAVDKFTKWIEAKPIKKLDGSSTIKFVNEIIVRYGVPHSIITDNETNFAKGVFVEFCSQKGIRLDLALVAHPQSNGQVEKANGLILAGIKPRLVEPLELSWLLGRGATLRALELAYHSQPLCWLHSFLPGLRGRGCVAHRHRIRRARVKAKEAHKDGVNLLEEAREQALARSALYSSNCDATIAGRFVLSHFVKEISYSGWSKTPRACTSYPLLGRDRSLSVGCQAMEHTTSSTRKSRGRIDKETECPWNVNHLRPFFY